MYSTYACMYPDCPFHGVEGIFNRNNAFLLYDQHDHALLQEPLTWRS